MPEERDWEWPWENPNWIVGPENKKDSAEDDNENDTPKNTGFDDTKEPVKDPPQYTVESAEIVVPEEGLKEGLPYRFKGKVRRLDNVPPANARISAQALYRYKDKEQATGNPLLIEIDKESLEFEGTIEELYEPNAYYLDKDKPADAKYRLLVKLRGECLDKDGFSKEVELPMATKTYILKKGCYDSTWSGIKSEPSKYPASGDNVFPNDTVKKVQTLLIKLRFLTKGNDTGYFGDLTEAAIREFQIVAKGQRRSKQTDGKIFYVTMSEITFKGADDGIYGPETELELANWNGKGWIRPEFNAKKGDVDDNGVRNGQGEQGADNYHEKEQITDYQKLLQQVGAYKGKIDGWFGPKMEAAIEWLTKCIEKCNFIDAKGNKNHLDVKELAKGHRSKRADEPKKKAAEKVVEEGAKVAVPENSFDIEKALDYLSKNIVQPYGEGKCAKHVRLGILAGGIDITPHPTPAKEYGPYLEKYGFIDVSGNSYQPAKGDILVMQSFIGAKNPYGHIQMYSGTNWISDFKQIELYPGSRYKENNAAFKIYRWKGK